jgi:lipid-A-disaccharide synthase
MGLVDDSGPILVITQGHAGDRLGAALAPGLRERFPDREILGVGGSAMDARGMRMIARSDGASVMGWAGLLAILVQGLRVLGKVDAETRHRLPACIVAVDVWQPLPYLHKRCPHLMTVPHVCYFPPGPNLVGHTRVHDKTLPYFSSIVTPFKHQERLYGAAGHRVRPAAHAGVEEMLRAVQPRPWAEREPILAVLPGSRDMELKFGLPVQREAVRTIRERYPELEPVVCCATAAHEARVKRLYPELRTTLDTRRVLAEARFGLICSGTASLEAALLACPGVVTYSGSPMQCWEWRTFIVPKLARMRAAGIASPYVALPNILAGKELYPELLDTTPDRVAKAALEILDGDLEARSEAVQAVRKELAWEDAGTTVAEEVAVAIERGQTPATQGAGRK